MRDYNHNGNVYGDVNVTDNSTQHKLLINCSDEELFEEREFRRNRQRSEWRSIFKVAAYGLIPGSICVIGYFAYALINDKAIVPVLIGLLQLSIPVASGFLKYTERKEAFVGHELALREIRSLLMQRGRE